MSSLFTEVPDSNTLFKDTEFIASNQDVADQWVSIRDLYPSGVNQPLLPEVFSREQFGQGNHYECFMLSALATLIRFPDVIRNCFVTKKVRQDGRYTFQFFRRQEWVKVEIDDTIPLEDDAVLYARSPTEHWWPLLLEKAYAKFYTGYDQLEGCTLQETFHDLTGNPVLNIPMDAKLAKAAGVNTKDGPYWLLMGECLLRGDHVLSALTKDAELESIGMQSEQQYAILGIFSLTGSSALDDIVIHLHNPFEDDEYEYSGPLNKNDSKWTAKLRQQYPVDDRYSIFIPLKLFLKSVNSIQHCFMRTIDAVSQTYSAAWKSESAGGNPTSVLWRKNPLFLVRNSGPAEVKIVTMIQQEDQRRFSNPDSDTTYAQCGVVVTRFTYQHPIPTFYVTGNSHKTIFKGLFLNSRDVSNVFTIPGHSMCYLVPCTMQKGVEASFQLSLYHLKDQDYSQLSVEQLTIPGMNWAGPATKDIELCQKKKDRADFYVDEGTDIHILTHQTKPYVSKSGGDAMTEDYTGMYLYDDTDRKIAGVHAATNFREISIIHRLPRSGRYAISITCPRAKGEVPAYITIVGSHASNVRIVDPPEDATMFDDEDIIDEGEDAALVHNPIDYVPVVFDVAHLDEQAESDSPFEDKRFYVDNRGATSEPWVHIGDLYPEGKTRPLLPNELSRDQFGQGDHYDCSTLTAFAALLEHHPDVIRNCFISKNPRKDGRYTFQFHRYGQWIKVEIDDRIPMVKDDTVFCRSPTHHWWPLLLEKAYAKFYTRYEDLENLSQEEVFHDYTGRPCISVSTDPAQAKVNMSYFDEAPYWKELASKLPDLCTTALASGREAEQYGLLKGRHYAVLDIVSIADGERVSDMLVKMYNPYEDSPYTGPMNAKDDAWTSELQSRFRPGDDSHAFYIPADNFVTAFSAMQMGYVGGLAEPSRHFNSEWGQDTNGGDTSLISWRKNPLFIFSNPTNDVVQLVAMLRQPDQRHLLHTMPNQELVYPMKGLSVAQANPSAAGIPTYLVTLDNHRLIHHEKPLAVREVTNVLTIPPQSVCYVAGHCNNRAVSKFLLSYWFMRGEDGEKLRIERYRPKVAQHQPAIAHVDLGNRASERVDFLIDTPTEVHAVLRQEKAFESPQGGDVIAQDYVGVYLYDLQNNCIKGLPSAMNYREVGLVTHLAKPGHYVFFITCPHSSGDVPCRVEIAADEDAHVRITETPQNAAALSALDMAFLDAHPESIPLSELPIDRDLPFQDDLAALERLLSDPSASAEEIQRLKDCLNERAHALAKAILASERPIYLISHDLHALNPLLDDDQAYMDAERERYYLKQDLRNHYKLPAQEAKLRSIADSIADELLHVDLSFIEARPEGIPRDAIPMISDKAFAEMTTDLLRLRRRPEPNPSAIRDAEHRLNERAKELARAMHDTERTYLDQQPQLVPLELLPLNTDESFCAEEDELRQLLQSSPSAQQTIAALQAKLNNHAHELARQLKDGERGKLLAASYEGIPTSELPLDTDAAFHEMEVERLRRVRTCADADADAEVARLEDEMRNRARDLAVSKKASERVMLRSMETPLTSGQLDALLDKDAETADMERRLRELRKKPDKNAAAIKALEEEVQKRAQELADGHLAEERSKCLAAEYGGRTMGALPLCDDAAYRDAEAAYMKMLESDHADAAALQRLIDTMNERAAGIAHDMNVADRAKYLPKALRGVPLRALPLDDDDEFRRLEHERARAAGTPGHKAEVEALEAQLLARADELARARLAGDRAYLAPEPAGIPLELVPLDEDAEFCAKEAQRAELKENGKADRSGIALRETELNARAVEVAQQLKDGERGKLLAASYEGIPTSELPLDTDAAFHEMEVERLRRVRTCADADADAEVARLEDEMRNRARDLAVSKKASERVMLRSMETPLTSGQLDALLDKDAETADMERRLRELRKKPDKNAAAIKALEEEVQKRAQELADGHLAEERSKCLAAEYGGRTMGALPLCDDAAYRDAEAAYMKMLESDHADAAALQWLIDTMNERAAGIAHDMNVADRAKYLPKALRGVPLRALPLDDDDEFRRLEHERARAAGTPGHKAEVEALEAQLLARADELARARLAGDRAYLAPEPAGIPLELVPLDEDAEFCAKEAQRAELKENGKADRSGIALRETELNARAVEVAQQLKDGERGKLLAASYEGIPTSELPLDTDAAFHEMEVERLRRVRTCADADADAEVARLEDEMRNRARDLAVSKKASERVMLRSMETPLTSGQLDALLDKDAETADMERRLRELRKKPDKNAAAIKALEEEVQKRAQELADGHLAEERSKCLAAEYGGRTMGALPLCDDAAYRDAEAAYMKMLESDHADAAALQWLIDTMNERAAGIAHDMNVADRAKYLPKALRGVPLRALPLDDDDEFRRLEHERARAAGTPGHKAEVEALEAQLLARADELARARLAGDRAYLAPEPAGIPLELVPLDEDAEFCAKEAQRAELKENGKADRSGIALRETELNARAVEVAQQLKDGERGKLLAASYEGIPTSELPLDTDAAFHEMEVERLRRVRTCADADADAEVARLEDEMRNRARDLAVSKKASERVMLRSMETPLTSGQLDALLDKDAETADMERRLRELRKKPDKNAAAIKALEEEVQKRAQELADGHLAEERSKCLAAEYGGRTMGALPLCDDAAYRDAEAAYMKMLESDHADAAALQWLIDTMNERAAGIAHDMNVADRAKYLPKALRGVPLRALPLDDDDEFRRLEHERARAAGTPGHKAEVEALEAQLLARADELARARLAGDRAYLAPEPAGIPLELVPLDEDAEFCAKEAQRAELKENGKADRSGIALRETELNARAVEVAQQLKDGERGKLLAASYEGIPTSELPLDTDAAFHEMEVERLRRVRTCADADADAEVARLEDEMRNRARDLAVSKKASERVMLRSMETPLTSGQLDALLDKDAETADMERRLRELRKKPDKNAAAIKALEEEVQKRAQELADGHLAEERSKCLAAEYGGRTMGALPLCDDAAYRDAEAAYMKMLESDHADAAALQRLIDTMNERAAGIAHDMNVADRAKYLPKALRGVPLRALPLDDDDEFRRLEHERARAAGTPGHKAEVEALEAQLLARADELARARLAGDRAYLAPEPAGIPLELVPLDEDAEFCAKEAQRAELKENGKADRSGIALRETELNARAVEVAQQLKDGERGKLLAASYEGIPTSELPLDTDAAFHEMEVEWLRLKVMDRQPNGATKSSLHAALNRRAADLARSLRVADLSSVEAAPLGLSKELLDLHNDSVCAVLIKEVRQLRQNAVGNTAVLREKESALNDRAFEVARRLLSGDRLSYLGPKPLSILLEHIPLDEDDVFHALEVERSMMKVTDPANSVAAVRKAENMLKDRACQLAELVMKEDLANFPPNYHGICTKDLKPHFDRLFSEAAEKRRAGMRDRTITFKENLEQIMDDRLNELALERKEGELYFIDPNPEGVPLSELPLSTDKAFNDLRQGRQELRESDPMENRKAIAGLEDEMNRRAAELARSVLSSDLDGLDKLPLGIPLDLLKPRQDAEVVRLIEELRRSKRLPQLKHNVAELQAKLNERVHELATAALEEGRDAYLDPHPEGVPREILPLRTDAVFQKEVQRAILRLQDPAKHAGAIAHLESELKACVKELALAQKEEDLRGLDQQPHDLPLTLLQPHQDAQLGKMIDELRWLKASEGDQHIAVKEVQSRMNDRCYAMADSAMKGDRCYLDPKPEKVPLRRLPLDTDAAFHALEVERAKLKLTDPRKNEHKIAGLEAQLNSRAAELARAVKKADLKSVEQTPRGIPLELLNLHEDPTFSALIAEKEQLPEGHSADLAARLLSSMNECAMKAADKLLRGDRGYLDQDPEGLPLGHLPLDTDTAFHEMEVERALLKARDPVKNSSTIKDLEAQLNKRAHDLANAALAMDRGYLSPRPEGVSIEELPLFTDSKFHSLEVERAKLKMSRADGHAERMQELEGRLNKRAASLAREQLEEDLKGLDQEPEGYPLNFLRPHNDAVFAAEVVSLRRAKKEPLVSAAKVRDAQEALNVRAHVLARERIAADRARLDQEPENVPLSLLTLEEDALFVAMEMKLRSLKASDKQSPRAIAEAEGRMNDRVHVMAAKVKAEGRDFLRSKSFDIPKELLALDADKAFVAMEKELWKQKQQPHAPRSSSAAADLRRKLQARADEVGEAQLKNDRDKYLDMQPEGVDLCDIPLDTDHAYHGMEVKRAILLAQDATGTRSAVEELDKELNARAHELAHEIVVGDRGYLPEEMHGIPVEELPLDTDRKFMKLERQRRAHKRSPDMKKEVAADEEELRNHALKLADEVIAMDLEPIKASYRGIAKEELNLHADVAFRELAKKRRRHRGKGRVEAAEVAAIEDEMDRRACEIADDLITAERAFLDPQPEGMYINEVPLDDDPTFQKLEQEYRRRRRDPRSAKQNGDVLRELTEAMNRRSHTLARAAFAKTRGFMEQEQEGIPLAELGLDEDPEFKEAEIARYRMNHSASPNAATVAEMELRMNERARELAWATLAADRVFLDPMPEGVLLGELPLDSDKEFGDLARERRRRKKTLKGGIGEAEVRAIEEKMNARSHELAKEFLEAERAFLSREPEGVPLADLPLNADSLFRAMEDERLQLKREPLGNAAIIAAKETDLEDRAHVIAKDLLRKERAFLDQEPLGVPLEELPLNHDEILNPIERKRRALRRHPKRNHEAIRACEEQMADRVGQIAEDFVQKERAFLDQNPEGVPLRYLPLNTDREFHERELQRRKLRLRREKNRSELADTERKMNERVHVLAKDLVLKGRAFLHSEPCGVPIADVPLNEDEDFRKMEEQRRALKEAGRSAACVKTIEEKLNNRAEELAQGLLDDERAFMDCAPLGIPLHDLPLNTDRRMREIERTRRHLRKFDPEGGAVDIAVLETGMNARAYELADQLLSSDRDYLQPEPCGVPLADLPLHTDRIFHEKELARFRAKKKGQTDLFQMEDELNERAMELAAEFIQTERAYLDQEPEGIPLERLPLDTDPIFHNIELERRRLKRSGENSPQVLELERLLNRRAHELSMELRGWQDPEFHAANEHVAEQWVRVCDLYPEGRYEDFVPAALAPGDVVSAPQDMSYLVPFIAALTQHPVLLRRLIVTKEAPVNAPYTFIFFDPHGNPVYVDVDDRVPCDDNREPKFAQSPYNLWYPLLLEKAYAKFVGGYDQLINCTSLETLRDLTGRPVTHTPFKRKLAEAGNLDNYMTVDFWLGVKEGMARGDVVVCSSNAEVPNGIHPCCSYALVDVVITLEGSVNPSDIVIKLENSYRNGEPVYTGPLCHTDVNWSLALQRVCQYDPERDDVLYLPLPTFVRNFSSMQTCHINCGDRLTVAGMWNDRTSGGNANFTTFRNNPIFILQNNSSRPATVLAELRHAAPQFVDPEGRSHYPQSGIALMEPTSSTAPLTPLITNSTARFLHKSIMLDSREVCSVMEVPAHSTCLFIPYTANPGQHGAFYVSVYPGSAKVALTPLHYCGLSREPKSAAVTLTPGAEGQRVDFTISSPCDVHVLLRQEKMTDRMAAIKGDAIAEDDVVMVAFSDQAMKLTSSGDPTNAREHSLVFRAEKPGYYSLLLTSPNEPFSGDNPCTVSIFTPKRVMVRFVAPPAGARQLQHTRFPKLPQKLAAALGGNNPRQSRGASTACQSQQRQHDERLPPLRKNGASTLSSGSVSRGDRFTCSF
ncbi:calpain-like cysteine peptidase [Leishmania donovani]|uniref:Calpain-like_cysteine_peptidase_putative/GeneDB:L mjF.27.0490/GeneDB:LmjF.27.0500/GeneDB:LmjF.27.0510 n=1 Tax=Leishmania donovani TaxID=5661 RepID=A0A6J8FFW9_LEIDO|nr:calpain-like cysteine peptidase [Leishmania donovani]VDZ45777.1 calpain-like_cysteine_peptidase_putative/GeneDB:LmjF.27.0490/GeneDB:LmjF.27.0500/GeneDB:LmjF.27.0510 [Leishmania donovani]